VLCPWERHAGFIPFWISVVISPACSKTGVSYLSQNSNILWTLRAWVRTLIIWGAVYYSTWKHKRYCYKMRRLFGCGT
jgi:hypothetical protein